MGKCTGQCSRLTLSYDFAFLALVRLAFSPEPIAFAQKRCLVHPLKKRNSMKPNAALDYCAGAAALLNYHKVRDDLSDETGFKKFRARLSYPFLANGRKKAIKSGLAELDAQISEGLAELARTEAAQTVSVDVPAALFGRILGDIIAFGLDGSDARIARSLGHAIGKWIYIADALDDWQEDKQKGRYNPFLLLYDSAPLRSDDLSGIRNALKNELYEAEAAIDLMEFENTDIKHIVLNILYLGMPERIDAICSDVKHENKHKKRKSSQHSKTAERTNNK